MHSLKYKLLGKELKSTKYRLSNLLLDKLNVDFNTAYKVFSTFKLYLLTNRQVAEETIMFQPWVMWAVDLAKGYFLAPIKFVSLQKQLNATQTTV